jgi:serine/threonine protein kinase
MAAATILYQVKESLATPPPKHRHCIVPNAASTVAELPINVYREIQALRHTDHVNVARALDVYPSGGYVCLVLEPMEGDVSALLAGDTPPPEDIVKAITLRLLRGLAHLHGAGIMHRVRTLPHRPCLT